MMSQPVPTPAPPARVLVVDDEPLTARTLERMVRHFGHEVQISYDGAAALEAARARPPDVVLLDIGLPRMSGLDVARRLRGELGLANALLVAMTGYGQIEDHRRSHEAGFNAHLVKPVDLERLSALLDRAFRDWLARLGPASDPAAERAWWQRLVRRAVTRLGDELVAAAGPAAWVGRTAIDRNGREVHYSSSQAEAWFRAGLARALPMGADQPKDQKQEVAA